MALQMCQLELALYPRKEAHFLPDQTDESHIHRSFLDRGHDTQQHETADIHTATLLLVNTVQGSYKRLFESIPLDHC